MHAILENPVQETVKERAPLSREELERRRKAVDFARANCALEGLHAGKDFDAIMDRYATGEINLDDLAVYRERLIQECINARK